MVSLCWTESVYNQVTIQPQQYLVLGQIRQKKWVRKYLLEKTKLWTTTVDSGDSSECQSGLRLLDPTVCHEKFTDCMSAYSHYKDGNEEQDKVMWADFK